MPRRRKTPADYHALAETRGFRWLGPEVSNVGTKTRWQCEHGHQWEARYGHIKRGTGCPVCARVARKTPADYHALAKERGFRWLGPKAPNVKTKTRWTCEQGHRWEACYHNLQHGTGCPTCARQALREHAKGAGYSRQRKTPADYHALARKQGFHWLGPEVSNNKTDTWWMCEQGHVWKARYGNIQSRTGCPTCAGVKPKTQADYRALAKERGFRWLGPEVTNVRAKTEWACEHGHHWQACYNNVQHGCGCPVCAGNARKTPADYRALAIERGFRWLGPEVSNVRARTGWECEHGHHWQACYSNIRRGTGCPVCAGQARKTPADYHALAEERGFHWLGPEVPNVFTKTSWECERGHQWKANYNNIRNGSGCPVCAREARKGRRQ
jgi:hypothetical protein